MARLAQAIGLVQGRGWLAELTARDCEYLAYIEYSEHLSVAAEDQFTVSH